MSKLSVTERVFDVVVVGGGPSGSAAAGRIASTGASVAVIEKKRYPREKTCGDGLTPRSVKALLDLDLDHQIAQYHRVRGLRAYGAGRMLELEWPSHPKFPSYGAVVTRARLDNDIAEWAKKQGAVYYEETEALAPVRSDDGAIESIKVRPKHEDPFELSSAYVIVADGSLSRFGRSLGNERSRRYPLGMAIRGYFDSPRHDDDFIESHLDIRDAAGRNLPGYGWVFPAGDGSVNVGVGVLSTFKAWRDVNTSHLMEAFSHMVPEYWGIDPEASRSVKGGKLPMGMSVRPQSGPNWLVVGDAGGVINPFNGEGIAYALETAELACDVLGKALQSDASALARYPELLDAHYARYYRTARAFVRLIGHPKIMRTMSAVGMRSRPFMQGILAVMANLLVPDTRKPENIAYKICEYLVAIGPEP